jgi:hypothetical protein
MEEIDIIREADSDLTRLEKREAELRAEIEIVVAEKSAILDFKKRADRYLQRRLPGLDARGDVPVADISEYGKRIPREGSKSRKIAEFCLKLLTAAQEPIEIARLLSQVLETNIKIESAKPAAYLAGILSRDPRFSFQRGDGWSLVIPSSENETASERQMADSAVSDERSDSAPRAAEKEEPEWTDSTKETD